MAHHDEKSVSADEAAVRALYRALHERWNARDARGFAALYSPQGFAVGFDGSVHDSPVSLEADLAMIFSHHPTAAYVAHVRGVRFVAPDVAILFAAAGLVPPGAEDINPAVNAFQLLVAARRDGAWRIESFQNTPAAFHGRPEAAEAVSEELRLALREEKARGRTDC
jgi:uncharacterized protein (TIGR02246 family)